MYTTEDVIANYEKLDFEIAKFAFLESEKRMRDTLDAKDSLEHRSLTLFGAYGTLSLAIFGVLITENLVGIPAIAFSILGLFILGAMFSALQALNPASYGQLGSQPENWVRDSVLFDEQHAACNFANLTINNQTMIDAGIASNKQKADKLKLSIDLGSFAAIVFAAITILSKLFIALN